MSVRERENARARARKGERETERERASEKGGGGDGGRERRRNRGLLEYGAPVRALCKGVRAIKMSSSGSRAISVTCEAESALEAAEPTPPECADGC